MKCLIAAFAASCLLASDASGQLYWNVDGTSQIREINTASGLITNTITSSGTSATRGAAPFGEDRLIYSLPFDIHTINADGTSDTLFNGDTAEGLAFNASTRTLYVYLNNVFRSVDTVKLSDDASRLREIFANGLVAVVVDEQENLQGLVTKMDLVDLLTKGVENPLES